MVDAWTQGRVTAPVEALTSLMSLRSWGRLFLWKCEEVAEKRGAVAGGGVLLNPVPPEGLGENDEFSAACGTSDRDVAMAISSVDEWFGSSRGVRGVESYGRSAKYLDQFNVRGERVRNDIAAIDLALRFVVNHAEIEMFQQTIRAADGAAKEKIAGENDSTAAVQQVAELLLLFRRVTNEGRFREQDQGVILQRARKSSKVIDAQGC